MGEVNLSINGKTYPILCDDGQESRIEELATYINSRLKDIAASGAANNDNHLLVLTSLILADEIQELKNNLQTADNLVADATSGGGSLTPADETAVAEAINSLASRINMVSDRIQKA